MKTAGTLAIIIFLVGMAYLIIIVMQPVTNSIVESVNATIDWTNYPETQAVLIGWPLWAYFVPATIGMVAVVIVLSTKGK